MNNIYYPLWKSVSSLIDRAKFIFELREGVTLKANYSYTHAHFRYVLGALYKGEIAVGTVADARANDPNVPTDISGIYSYNDNKIYINPNAQTVDELSTVIHELTHALNDWYGYKLTYATDEFTGQLIKSIFLEGHGITATTSIDNECRNLIREKDIMSNKR